MRFIFYYCISTKIIVTIVSFLRYNKKRKAMLTNLKYTFRTSIVSVVLIIGNSLFAQNGLTITDNPVAAMLDSLANQKILEKTKEYLINSYLEGTKIILEITKNNKSNYL